MLEHSFEARREIAKRILHRECRRAIGAGADLALDSDGLFPNWLDGVLTYADWNAEAAEPFTDEQGNEIEPREYIDDIREYLETASIAEHWDLLYSAGVEALAPANDGISVAGSGRGKALLVQYVKSLIPAATLTPFGIFQTAASLLKGFGGEKKRLWSEEDHHLVMRYLAENPGLAPFEIAQAVIQEVGRDASLFAVNAGMKTSEAFDKILASIASSDLSGARAGCLTVPVSSDDPEIELRYSAIQDLDLSGEEPQRNRSNKPR